MPRALKDFREAETFNDTTRGRQSDKYDRVLFGAMTTGAILAVVVFAYVAVRFFPQ